MTPEQKASQIVRERASAYGMKLLRNNSGVLMNEVNVPVRFGLGNENKKLNKVMKTGDYVGPAPLLITPEMVGKTVAIFANVEVKAEGFKHRETYPKSSREFGQDRFNKLINDMNGMAGFACCAADVDRIVKEFVERMKS